MRLALFVDGIAYSSMFSRPMKMEIVPCAHPINCDTIFDPHVAECLQLFVSEGVWHEDGRNNSCLLYTSDAADE